MNKFKRRTYKTKRKRKNETKRLRHSHTRIHILYILIKILCRKNDVTRVSLHCAANDNIDIHFCVFQFSSRHSRSHAYACVAYVHLMLAHSLTHTHILIRTKNSFAGINVYSSSSLYIIIFAFSFVHRPFPLHSFGTQFVRLIPKETRGAQKYEENELTCVDTITTTATTTTINGPEKADETRSRKTTAQYWQKYQIK